MPKISVIVPVYNVEKYLHRCIDSILAQTFTDWELLLVDDGSSDRSGEICEEYAKKDSRIRAFHKKNGGVSSARNLGLDKTKAIWVVFVDSDDWCEPNYLSDFFIFEGLCDGDIVLQGRKNDANDKAVELQVLKSKIYTNVAEAMLDNDLLTFGAPYCKLYSRKMIEEYDIRFPEEYSYGEDTTFFFKVMTVSKRVFTSSKCNYHYVDIVDGSLSKKDHDFEPLAKFLADSMGLVKIIDVQSRVENQLVEAYYPNYRNLVLRSVANMYRLGYGNRKKLQCFNKIKKELLFGFNFKLDLISWVIYLFPAYALVAIFYMVMRFRK